jgi:homoserine kinase
MKKNITVKIPATSANLGPGFDVLGVAVQLYNEVTLETDRVVNSSRKPASMPLSAEIRGAGVDSLPLDDSNLVVRAAFNVFQKTKRWPASLYVRMLNRIPLSRGLGSSAAATLGGMCAANRLVGSPLSDQEVLDMAVELEGHPDNLVPAMFGGICVAGMIQHHARYLKFRAPWSLRAVICVPHLTLSTSEARRVLPSRIPLSAAVFTSSRLAFLIGALIQRRYDYLSFAMDDVLHQPARATMLPGLAEVIDEAKRAGAYGSALSGAGSCVIAFTRPGATAKQVGQAMQKKFAAFDVGSNWFDVALLNSGIIYK